MLPPPHSQLCQSDHIEAGEGWQSIAHKVNDAPLGGLDTRSNRNGSPSLFIKAIAAWRGRLVMH